MRMYSTCLPAGRNNANMNSELRQDLVSGDWIVVAPGRAKRPNFFTKNKSKRKADRIKGCPFERPQFLNNEKPDLIYPNHHDWAVQVFPNKYPAVVHKNKNVRVGVFKHGPYSIFPGVGHHDVVVTRDHYKNFPRLSRDKANLVFRAFQDRYLVLSDHNYIDYVSILHNWGPSAGASVFHPHYQIISIPMVPPDVNHSLTGSARYFKSHRKCVHCVMIDLELKEKKRIIFENDKAVAFAPFVSRGPFEVRVFPKRHLPYFENTYDEDMESVVEALQHSLRSLEKNLGDPDYNFFIHTAPVKNKERYRHYHWHIEITPVISIRGGFEWGTGIDINVIDPDDAAKILRV